jgi:hypothetical protein
MPWLLRIIKLRGWLIPASFFIFGWYSCHTYEKSNRLEEEAQSVLSYESKVKEIMDRYEHDKPEIKNNDPLPDDIMRVIISVPDPRN